MGVAPTVAVGPLADRSISNFACNISNYLCTNFGAFIKKCTIDQLIRSTIMNLDVIKLLNINPFITDVSYMIHHGLLNTRLYMSHLRGQN